MSKRTQTYSTADYSVFVKQADKLQMNERDLAFSIGYSRGAVNSWKKANKIPKAVELACECLVRRNGIKNEIVISASDLDIIKGDGICTEIHPGIYVIKL